jgi:hypothetical protein
VSALLIAIGLALLLWAPVRERSLVRVALPGLALALGTPLFGLAISSALAAAIAFLLTAALVSFGSGGRAEWRAGLALLAGLAASAASPSGLRSLSYAGEGLFGPASGLFFRSPLLWLAVAGLALGRTRAQLFSGLCGTAALIGAATSPRGAAPSVLLGVALALLFAPLASTIDGLRSKLRAHPAWAIGFAAAALVLWNGLSMESYRRALVPRDDTVAFARLAEQNAAILRSWTGTPLSWPANLVFAHSTGLPAARWDRLASAYLFEPPPGLTDAIVLSGEDASDLLDGAWGERIPCPPTTCRVLAGAGEVYFGLRRREPLLLSIEARGDALLRVELNGHALAGLPLSSALESRSLRLAPGFLLSGLNRLKLVPEGGAARVARISFRRDGAR